MRLTSAVVALLIPAALIAQDDDSPPSYRITDQYIRELAKQNSLLFALPVTIKGRTARVHAASSDCEMHLAGTSGIKIGFPGAIVVEPPNLCANDPPEALGRGWGNVFDDHVLNQKCTAIGYPRIYAEHIENGTPPANPPHMVEIHPALKLNCPDEKLDFTGFLGIVPNMAAIQETSAQKCLDGYELSIRRNSKSGDFEFFEKRPNLCGNFAKFEVVVDPMYVRDVKGGHSAIAQAWSGDAGPYALKIYTYADTPEDKELVRIRRERDESPEQPMHLHGMLTIDYFAILKTARDAKGQWLPLNTLTRVPYPLAFVVFGKAIE